MWKRKFINLALAGVIGFNFISFGKEKIETRLLQRTKIVSGRVTVIDGTTLTVEKNGRTYLVLTDGKTQFRRKFWGKSDLTEFSVGNLVNVIGRWTDEGKTQIQAVLVRNLSIQKKRGVFFGEVVGIVGGENSLVMKTAKRGEEAVSLSSSTKLVNRKMEVIGLIDVKSGHKIRVKGLWDASKKTITEVTQIKDFSLPVRPSPTPS